MILICEKLMGNDVRKNGHSTKLLFAFQNIQGLNVEAKNLDPADKQRDDG